MHVAGRRRRKRVRGGSARTGPVRIGGGSIGIKEGAAFLSNMALPWLRLLGILYIAGIKEFVCFGRVGGHVGMSGRAIVLHNYTKTRSGSLPALTSPICIRGSARSDVCDFGAALPRAGTRRNISGKEAANRSGDIVSLDVGDGGCNGRRPSCQRAGYRGAFCSDFWGQGGSIYGSGSSGSLARPFVGRRRHDR